MKSSHKTRLEKWLRLCPEPTRILSTLISSQLVPKLQTEGFTWVDVSLRDQNQPVSGSVIELERWDATHVDSVMFNFDKYRTPRFQVQGWRRLVDSPHALVRSGNLVTRPSQYIHFWGKPWWVPIGMWPKNAPSHTVAHVEQYLPQLTGFLASGERGHKISRAVAPRGAA